MELFRPALDMRDAFADYVRDWETHGETVMPGAAVMAGRTYAQWLEATWKMEQKPWGGYVPAHLFFGMENGRILGAIALRHTLNDFLLRVGGHIGYGVRPSERGHGYAAAMVKALLPGAAVLGLTRVMISCKKENLASAKTIQHCGGVLENEVAEDAHIVQRYWITL